ncbi:hypothetical protein T459_30978 [Capsicum annuum]|uniref:Uncharacterized protein n=1 Tax=Capsicum annuum TaxID=4072 RepID=A0A1U8F198_CAPAN|nr:auxin-responsive protein SAUR50-like [Capsicum annuum]KAF3620230.1 putative filament-like plant protein 6-like [Capsicum annuum]PHT66553.1 hypothetical protein T459_30978 [Capsicum annuum]
MSACSKIRHIVALRQMLQRWRKKAARRCVPIDVPSGHVAITVGTNCKRYVVRATYLNHPMFKKLLSQAEEEYGFTNSGPLAIPCGELFFEEFLSHLDNNKSMLVNFEDFQRYCHMDARSNLDFRGDSRPLLHTKFVW